MNYQEIVNNQKMYFLTNITKSYNFRVNNLKTLKNIIIKHEKSILEALNKDLGKANTESYMTEVGLVLQELNYHIKNLKKMMKIKKVKTPLTLFPAKSYVYSEPYGTVLIVAPWNYPFLLAINPLIGAISAGNTAIIKPSEHALNTSKVIEEIINEAFNNKYITVINGGISETTKLLENKFDYLFFTGSTKVGKIMMKKMSDHLTPLTLELGGKSPTIVTKDSNIELTAKRIAYGKTINAGQTCIAPDYLLIDESILNEFVLYYQKAIKEFYNNPLDNDNYPKIINKQHHDRLINLYKNEKILFGGKFSENKIAPTLVLINNDNNDIMQEEIFGPILPIITFSKIEEAFNYIVSGEKPLAAYLFTKSKEIKKTFVEKISAGGLVINDTLMHFANHHLPFGGVGLSGMGKYHGKASFETFSHFKAVLDKKTYLDIKMRYHPVSKRSFKIIKRILK